MSGTGSTGSRGVTHSGSTALSHSDVLARPSHESTAGSTVHRRSGPLESELAQIVHAASMRQIGGVHTRLEATYFWVRTTIGEDPLAARLEAAQRRLGQGPSLEPLTGSIVYLCHDLAEEVRWTDLAASACEIGVRSLLICRLQPASGCDVTLTSCSPVVGAFGYAEAAGALALAARAATVLTGVWGLEGLL